MLSSKQAVYFWFGVSSFVVLAAYQLSPCFFRLPSFSTGVKVRSSLGWASAAHRGKPSYFGLWLFGFGSVRWPNKSVKGTRRPLAVLDFGFFQSSAASFRFRCWRRAPYRNVRLFKVRAVGFGLPSPASVVADNFLVWFGLPFLICSLAFTPLPCLVLASVCSVGCFFGRLGGLSSWFPLLSKTQFLAWPCRFRRLPESLAVTLGLGWAVFSGICLVLALASGCLHTSVARFRFCQVVLPASLCGCRLS